MVSKTYVNQPLKVHMGINTGTPQFDQDAAAAAAPSASSSPRFEEKGPSFSQPARSFLDGYTGVIPSNLPAEQLRKLRENITKIFEQREVQTEFGLQLIDLDKEQDRLYYSGLLIAVFNKNRPNKVAVYTIIIESSAKVPNPSVKTLNWGNNSTGNAQTRNIEVLYTPHNIVDKVFRDRASARVQAVLNGAEILRAGTSILPSDFNVEDTAALANYLAAVTDACWSRLWVDSQGSDVNLGQMANDAFISVEPTVGRSTRFTPEGYPYRADFVIRVDAVPATKTDSKSWNDQGNKEREIGSVAGFFDVMFWPRGQVGWSGQQLGVNADPSENNPYLPRMVVTGVDNKYLPTMSTYLLLLSMVNALSDKNKEYFRYFYQSIEARRRSNDKNRLDWTDVGALSIEAGLVQGKSNEAPTHGKRAPTQDATFDLAAFNLLMSGVLFRPGMVYSVDVPWMGLAADGLDTLRMCAMNVQTATQEVLGSLDVLTNGLASPALAQSGASSLFEADETIVHLGSYIDQNGEIADIRNVDHTAVVNYFGERDPSVIRLWHDSFYNSALPHEVRLDTRKRIIEEMCGKDAKFTGFAHRLTWKSKAFFAIAKAINDVGFRPTLRSNGISLDLENVTPGLIGAVADGQYGGLNFNHGWQGGNGNTGPAGGFGGDFFGR